MSNANFDNLPRPFDDGACDHLANLELPPIKLSPTDNPESPIDISQLQGLTVIFCYPRSATAKEEIPPEWDAIPGARGCTPQACSFRDNSAALREHGVKHLYGVSTQPTAYQQEFKNRSHLPYELLSDDRLEFATALALPLFQYQGMKLIKRITLAIENGKIVKKWYPVFPPDQNVFEVLNWLKQR
ncbi:hypothetical protein E8E14_013404 [Neopestalotiopsis sp. 37M]|nr:hypothetical protein E8E14_013404 [Neopestalotiopsis sp. 37M]